MANDAVEASITPARVEAALQVWLVESVPWHRDKRMHWTETDPKDAAWHAKCREDMARALAAADAVAQETMK